MFAQAYQKQIGGNKTGSEAIQQLLADMKKGKVTSDILTYAGAEASTRANAGGALGLASQASQAEQGRFQNAVSGTAILASNNGVEEGFARIFRTLTDGLNESNGLVRTLAEGFNQATIETSKLLLFPQSFIRALDGRDSLVADWLGVDQVKELRSDWAEIKTSLDSILGLSTPDWFIGLKDVAQQLKELIGAGGMISQRFREAKTATDLIQQDAISEFGGYGLNLAGPTGETIGQGVGRGVGYLKSGYFALSSGLDLAEQGVGYGLKKIKDTVPFGNYTPVSGLVDNLSEYLSTPSDTYLKYRINRDRDNIPGSVFEYGANGENLRNYYLSNDKKSSESAFDSAMNSYKQAGSQSTTNENKFDVNVTINAQDTGSIKGEMEEYFSYKFQSDIDTAMLSFKEK